MSKHVHRRPRSVTIKLTPGECRELWRMADNSYAHGEWIADYMKHEDSHAKNNARNAYEKLALAVRDTTNG